MTEIEKLEQEWLDEKNAFFAEQERINAIIENYLQYADVEAVENYHKELLMQSTYTIPFNKRVETLYSLSSKTLVIDYNLPKPTDLPAIKEIKYIAARNETKEVMFSETQMNKKYSDVIYKMVLRSLYETFDNDSLNLIDAVNFNGWVTDINKANGKTEMNCIVSIFVKKSNFKEIDLRNVEAKACFQSLKGVGSANLYGLSAIVPIMQINKHDRRIVEAKDVYVSEGVNLAEMDWEDFEHLVRNIFEKEFSQNGAEVKVTQSSRDGGVDAIAYDPDPIRGGKIIIQAKRYTNTVGVSAVRDLYGTVMNEGAIKGILITTSAYGSDSYNFAKDKPLSLLNGGHLLYLLEKHGQKARINIEEARQNRLNG